MRRRFRRGREAAVEQLAGLLREVLPARGVKADDRLISAIAELLASLAEGGVRILLDPGSDWTPEALGRLLGSLATGAIDQV